MDELIFAKGWRSPPSRTLLDHWSQYAVPIVLSMFSAEVAGRRHYGRMAFLPQMLLHCPDDSPLILCCQALAFAYLANKAGSSEAEGVRDEIYGQALAATNRLVGDSDSAKEDETSVSVWLLSIYEVRYQILTGFAFANTEHRLYTDLTYRLLPPVTLHGVYTYKVLLDFFESEVLTKCRRSRAEIFFGSYRHRRRFNLWSQVSSARTLLNLGSKTFRLRTLISIPT